MLSCADRPLSAGVVLKKSRRSTVRRLALLAPHFPSVRPFFPEQPETKTSYGGDMLAKVQRLRGRVYLDDGAIQPHELIDGRHRMDVDWWSWHLLVLDGDDVQGCVRYTAHSNTTSFRELGVSKCSLARSHEWGTKLEAAVEDELEFARRSGVPYVEVGGWALDESIRGSAEALRMVLSVYALSQERGGIGISTATHRHCSASILKKLGGFSLEHDGLALPAYFDPDYNCEMEVLRFHSWAPNPRFEPWINEIKTELRSLQVIRSQYHRN